MMTYADTRKGEGDACGDGNGGINPKSGWVSLGLLWEAAHGASLAYSVHEAF